jgi:hypothetical protein
MKNMKKLLCILFVALASLLTENLHAQSACKPVLDGGVVENITLENLVKWCDSKPLIIQCDDGKKYELKTFQVTFFTLKPLMNREFGIGEGGIPIKARETVAKGLTGDALILKEVNMSATTGESLQVPVISFKIK